MSQVQTTSDIDNPIECYGTKIRGRLVVLILLLIPIAEIIWLGVLGLLIVRWIQQLF